LEGHTDNVNAISVDHKFVYSISDDASLRVYSKSDWMEVYTVQLPVTKIDALTIDGDSLYLGCSDGSIRQLLKKHIEG
jgi:WD40 repeat protein